MARAPWGSAWLSASSVRPLDERIFADIETRQNLRSPCCSRSALLDAAAAATWSAVACRGNKLRPPRPNWHRWQRRISLKPRVILDAARALAIWSQAGESRVFARPPGRWSNPSSASATCRDEGGHGPLARAKLSWARGGSTASSSGVRAARPRSLRLTSRGRHKARVLRSGVDSHRVELSGMPPPLLLPRSTSNLMARSP